jgi:hypothetical protein
MLNAVKSRVSRDAPGIPSSARDHSLSPWLTTLSRASRDSRGKSRSFAGFKHAPVAHGPINSGAGAPGSNFWIPDRSRGQALDWKKKRERNAKIFDFGSPIAVEDKFWIEEKRDNDNRTRISLIHRIKRVQGAKRVPICENR